jgi:predicted O-linked N-acetylglucosamine transferase (SPINDLY family)
MNTSSQNQLLEIAKYQFERKNYALAEQILLDAINSQNAKSPHFELLAYVYGNQGNQSQVQKYLTIACSYSNASPEAHFYLGRELIKQNRMAEGINHIEISLENAGEFIEGLHELGLGYLKIKNPQRALNYFERAILLNKNNVDLLFNIAKLHSEELNDYEKGFEIYDQILDIDPKHVNSLIAKGVLYDLLEKYDDSVNCYLNAIEINPELPMALHNYALTLVKLNRCSDAIPYFEKAISFDEFNPIYLSNLGMGFLTLKKYSNAFYFYNAALNNKKDHVDAWIGKAICEFKDNKISDAFFSINHAIKYESNRAEPWFWRGNFYADIKNFPLAIENYEIAKTLKHDHLPLLGALLQIKMKSLDWNNISSVFSAIKDKVLQDKYIVDPLIFQAINDDPALNLKCSQAWTKVQFQKFNSQFNNSFKKKKIRIAYISPDFRNHPVLHLTKKIYELHDRSKFEIYGYQLITESDELTTEISNYFDSFFDVSLLSDEALINHIRDNYIDIAVDLAGHTQNARTNIFLNRVAPIQINFIGYPGTLGSPAYDYIIGDAVLIPPNDYQYYSEKVLTLPRTFQPNGERYKSSRFKLRSDLNLPEDAFIYCCFNSNYKITNAIFNTWLNILEKSTKSILWLFVANDVVKSNVHKAVEMRGICKSRIVFADQILYADHLNRLEFADLFLDTTPFNAGTTCSDSLWAGVPIITMKGKSFCGKMTESILSSIALNELVTDSPGDYEDLAVRMYQDNYFYESIKAKLHQNIRESKFFDSVEYVRELERIYIELMD